MFGSLQSKFDVYTLYDKMLTDMELAQTPEGLIPDICPEYVTFLDGFRDSPEWGSAFVLAPWLVYEYYGDFRLVERHYEAMKRYVDYLGTKADGHILSHGLGDWCDLGPKYPGRAQLTSLAGTATPIYYMDAETIRKAAEKMGRKEDAAKYGKLAQDIRKAYNEKYYHPQTGSYDKNSQAGNALALYSGICEPQNRDAVLAEPGAGHPQPRQCADGGRRGIQLRAAGAGAEREFAGDLRHELAIRRIRLRLYARPRRHGAARIMAGTAPQVA